MKRSSIYDYDESMREVPLVRRRYDEDDALREPSEIINRAQVTTALIGTACFAVGIAILFGFALIGGAA